MLATATGDRDRVARSVGVASKRPGYVARQNAVIFHTIHDELIIDVVSKTHLYTIQHSANIEIMLFETIFVKKLAKFFFPKARQTK